VITSFDVLAVATPNLMEVVNICLPYVDFFIPNYEETVMICGLRGRQEIVRYFLDRGAKHTVCVWAQMGARSERPKVKYEGDSNPSV
jgi:sugar/nucleoside kinase (ribokinase family)